MILFANLLLFVFIFVILCYGFQWIVLSYCFKFVVLHILLWICISRREHKSFLIYSMLANWSVNTTYIIQIVTSIPPSQSGRCNDFFSVIISGYVIRPSNRRSVCFMRTNATPGYQASSYQIRILQQNYVSCFLFFFFLNEWFVRYRPNFAIFTNDEHKYLLVLLLVV